jgi:hypothetical protein
MSVCGLVVLAEYGVDVQLLCVRIFHSVFPHILHSDKYLNNYVWEMPINAH